MGNEWVMENVFKLSVSNNLGLYVGELSTKEIIIGVKPIGERPTFKSYTITIRISSADYTSVKNCISNVKIVDWVYDILDGAILIQASEEELFASVETLMRFYVSSGDVYSFADIIFRMIQTKIESYNCVVESVTIN